MKKFITVLLFFCYANLLCAQNRFVDSLLHIISENKEDEREVNALALLGNNLQNTSLAHKYLAEGLQLSKKINYKKGQADCNLLLAVINERNGMEDKSLQYALNALGIYQQINDVTGIASSHLLLQGEYREAEDFSNALLHELEGEKVAAANNVIGLYIFPQHRLTPLFLAETGQTYILMNKPDSALKYVQLSIHQNELFYSSSWSFPFYLLATLQQLNGDYNSSIENYRKAKRLTILNKTPNDTLQIYSGMSTLFEKTKQYDSSIFYAQIVRTVWNPKISEIKNLLEAINNLYEVYEIKGQNDSTLKYLSLNYKLRNIFFNTEREKQIQETTFNQQLKQEQLIAEQSKYKSRIQLFWFIALLLVLFIITILEVRNNRHHKKAKIKIENAYAELKSTQAQLIQSEKMASLGELTAGIAHEIQNPLNFVNNFSEVNKEMIAEMKNNIDNGNFDEVKNIANDIETNEEKINYHGKRADAIVKGMLQHSRQTSNVKEPTDINSLCDEYLRLSYHGLRAKDKKFNVDIKTDFDKSINTINIVAQDIGRVLLNLYTNAFYATSEKAKYAGKYQPAVSVSTKKENNKIFIYVADNGNGIPSKIIDKIFQPFFTTKPSGQGTGLGLSLSYDIIKANDGEINVVTNEGIGSTFIIQLPIG